ncbi:MAG: BREX-1 system phosphatase PglZ type A [Akkermansiaceae bacterium]
MSERIHNALSKLFEMNRIVLWYDVKSELRGDYESLELAGVEKVEVRDNELSVKYRTLRLERDKNFLLYHEGPAPEDSQNWLLDMQLAHRLFQADQASIWLEEIGLSTEFYEITTEHKDFFGAQSRIDALKERIEPEDTLKQLRLKMLAVCARVKVGNSAKIDTVIEALLDDFAAGKDARYKLIERSGLEGFLWAEVSRLYSYVSTEMTLLDFTIKLFRNAYEKHVRGDSMLNDEAIALLSRWKNSRLHGASFEQVSERISELLNMREEVSLADLEDFQSVDYFEVIEKRVIQLLIQKVVEKTITSGQVTKLIRERGQSHWYDKYRNLYDAIEYAALYEQQLSETDLGIDDLRSGVELYVSQWYRIDQLYRKFTHAVQKSGHHGALQQLTDSVESSYNNQYLLGLNDRWQFHINKLEEWKIPGSRMQRDFYREYVKKSPAKVCVIISDGLRYEIGEELASAMKSTNRYLAELEHAVSAQPSYTQLGMASLLPHEQLSFSDKDNGLVLADGESTTGLVARDKVLKREEAKSSALKASDVLKYGRDEIRSMCADNQVVYIYHNTIDSTADKSETEGKVFDAAAVAIEEINHLITKIGGENYIAKFIVTADHGFIYQDRKLQESDFSTVSPEGDALPVKKSRYVIGSGLQENNSMKKWTAGQLHLQGEQEVLIPNSINRIRVQGSGSRYVHGGAALQEIIIPVVHITKKRVDDTDKVEVNISSSSNVITTAQHPVTLRQVEPCSEKLHGRVLRIGFYAEDGTLISSQHTLKFDLVSEDPRERDQRVTLILSADAEKYNNQVITLLVEEKVKNSEHFSKYQSLPFTHRRQIGDIDIF